MTKKLPVFLICICICIAAAAICAAGAVAIINMHNAAAGTSPQSTQDTPVPAYTEILQPTAEQTINPQISGSASENPTSVYTEIPPTVLPTQTQQTVVTPTINPTTQYTYNPTSAPTPVPTLSPLQKEGINLLAGNWHGSQTILFVASGEFDAVCKSDFTGTLSGKVNIGGSPTNFVLPITWEYTGSQNFIATTGDGSTIPFTCDGTTLTLNVNLQKNIDSSYPDTTIPIILNKI
ncbi:MAG TPA: hypothetical protein O0X70_01690 [Methanocorpusculum sp.]|nr:hypothetical protein [Methanocorpusculum sp.]